MSGSLLDLAASSDSSTVHGLAFGGLAGDGGTTAMSVESNKNAITGNWIGVAADLSSVGLSNYGIEVTGNENTIGGGAAGDANVITGSGQQAISIDSPNGDTPASGNVVQGNLIGFEPDGTPASGQGNGISVSDATGTVVGNNDPPNGLADVQAHPELGNVISGMGDAIRILGGSSGTVVAGNFIGVDRGGVPTGLNADGVVVNASSGNQIGPGNRIVHATNDGVWIVGGGTGDRIVANSIFASGKLGIELDSSTNSNNGIAAPVITSVSGDTVSGTFTSLNFDSVFIEVFVNPTCAAPFASGAGQTFVTFVGPVAPGPWSAQVGGLADGEGVSVTATDTFTSDTSQFSNCSSHAESIAFESNRVNSTSQIFTMNPDGSNVTQLTSDPVGTTDTLPSISPDGHTVVYQSNVSGTDQIWAINGDGSNPRQLTTDHTNRQPTFSPDGTKIAFDSNRNGNFQLFVMNADGSGQTQVMTTDGNVGGSGWSPDGSQIAYNDDTNGTNQIYTVNVGTGIVTGPLTTSGANTNPHWSPDGSEILFVSTRCDPNGVAELPTCGGGASVFLMNADGSNQHNLTDASIFDADPAWSPDGTHIAFVRDLTGQAFNVFTANADGTNQVQLTNGGAPSRNSFPNWGTQVNPLLSNLTVNVTPSSAGAGIDQVPIPPSRTPGSRSSRAPRTRLRLGRLRWARRRSARRLLARPRLVRPRLARPRSDRPPSARRRSARRPWARPAARLPVGSTRSARRRWSTALASLLLSQIPLAATSRCPERRRPSASPTTPRGRRCSPTRHSRASRSTRSRSAKSPATRRRRLGLPHCR